MPEGVDQPRNHGNKKKKKQIFCLCFAFLCFVGDSLPRRGCRGVAAVNTLTTALSLRLSFVRDGRYRRGNCPGPCPPGRQRGLPFARRAAQPERLPTGLPDDRG